MTTIVGDPKFFTEDQAKAFNREVREKVEKHRASLAAPRPAKLPELLPITDWNEAREKHFQLALMGDATKAYESACEDHFEVCEQVRMIEEILPSATADEKRAILGYSVKKTPSLPGLLDEYVHVEGSLERLKARIEQIEKELPLMQAKAERYLQLKKQLEAWPVWKIDRLRNEEVERGAIVEGKPVQKRGISGDMTGRTVLTTR